MSITSGELQRNIMANIYPNTEVDVYAFRLCENQVFSGKTKLNNFHEIAEEEEIVFRNSEMTYSTVVNFIARMAIMYGAIGIEFLSEQSAHCVVVRHKDAEFTITDCVFTERDEETRLLDIEDLDKLFHEESDASEFFKSEMPIYASTVFVLVPNL